MIITAIIVLGTLGFVFAAMLGLAAEYFRVNEDPRLKEILAALPGTNCGACGSAGCANFAERLLKGEVLIAGCVAGGQTVADRLAKIMGMEAGEQCVNIATVHCGATAGQRRIKARYSGTKSCTTANLVDSGGLLCSYGCLGYGDCFTACPFDAIKMHDGLPVIDSKKCTACGRCVVACPRAIIALRPCSWPTVVACSSRDKGSVTRKNCPVGCIACGLCAKINPQAFKVEGNLARVIYNQAPADCREAVAKCPTKCILNLE